MSLKTDKCISICQTGCLIISRTSPRSIGSTSHASDLKPFFLIIWSFVALFWVDDRVMIRIWFELSSGNDSSSELRASINCFVLVWYEPNRLIGSESYQRSSVTNIGKSVGTATWQHRDLLGWRMLKLVNFKIFLP